MAQNPGLSVRQFKRESVQLPMQFIVADEHRAQVRFTTSSPASNQYTLSVVATDLSPGGIGMESRVYLPRMCEGTIRLFDEARTVAGDDAIGEAEHVIEARVKVRRIVLSNHLPTYEIGLSFLDPTPELVARINDLCLTNGHEQEGSPDG